MLLIGSVMEGGMKVVIGIRRGLIKFGRQLLKLRTNCQMPWKLLHWSG